MTIPSDPANPDPIRGLLQQAAATSYCRPALRALGEALPPDDAILTISSTPPSAPRSTKNATPPIWKKSAKKPPPA